MNKIGKIILSIAICLLIAPVYSMERTRSNLEKFTDALGKYQKDPGENFEALLTAFQRLNQDQKIQAFDKAEALEISLEEITGEEKPRPKKQMKKEEKELKAHLPI